MNSFHRPLRFSRPLLTMLVSLGCLAAATARRSAAPVDPRREMIAALGADQAHRVLGAEAALFDRFVGTWDVEYTIFGVGKSAQRFTGQLLFGWIIDGHALQDIWVSDAPPGSSGERTLGTSLRFFDVAAQKWRVVFVAPSFGSILQLEGGAEGDRIVLHGRDTDGSRLRWSFHSIQSDSFGWRGEQSRDDGETWLLQEEHRMHRRTGAKR